MRAVMLSWVTALTVALTSVHAADAPTPTAEAHALFDDYWNWLTESYPDIASLYFGDGRFAALGERFDLRRFHNAVIDNGALPLQILERQIDEWIESERAATGR